MGINSIKYSFSNDLLSIHMCQALDLSLKSVDTAFLWAKHTNKYSISGA